MIRGLEKIKTLEQYELAKKDLQYCVHEYKWISESKDPKKEIEDELKECMKLLRDNMDRDEELNLLSRIHTLKTKYIAVVRDEYKNEVKTNIIGLVLTTEQFEAANQNISFADIINGLIRGDEKTKSYLKKKYMFTLSNMYGVIPAPHNLKLEKMEDILDYIAKNYELVDIDLSDRNDIKKEMELVPVEEPIGIKARVIENVNSIAESRLGEFDDVHDSVGADSKAEAKENIQVRKSVEHTHDEKEYSKPEHKEGEIEK